MEETHPGFEKLILADIKVLPAEEEAGEALGVDARIADLANNQVLERRLVEWNLRPHATRTHNAYAPHVTSALSHRPNLLIVGDNRSTSRRSTGNKRSSWVPVGGTLFRQVPVSMHSTAVSSSKFDLARALPLGRP